MKRLPVGIQTFRQIIEGGYVYADKTGYIRDLADSGKFFFLSRPRRFGKSLLVDTMKEAFQGHRELFDGLALGSSDFDFTPSPVIRLDLSAFNVTTPERLRLGLAYQLTSIGEAMGVALSGTYPDLLLSQLIERVHATTGRSVVVLIDEYDKPVIEHLDDPAAAEANRLELRGVYGILKAMDPYLRFVFLTGVSKFTRMSIFSQLNNLTDITLFPGYENICGFTEHDFDDLFADHLDVLCERRATLGMESDRDLVRQMVFDWYDGFSWDGVTRVFNPFSLLSLFTRLEFYPFWFSSGIPRFLVKAMVDEPAGYAEIQTESITEMALDSHEIEDAPLASLLFQTGFLTVKSATKTDPRIFRLGFPNFEVSSSFSRQFLETSVGRSTPGLQSWYARTLQALNDGHPEFLQEALEGLFAALPYNFHESANEAFYHAIFLAVMQFLGLRLLAEVAVAGGEIDGVIDQPNGKSYVIELKHERIGDETDAAAVLDRLANAAMAQIDAKGYADRYRGTRKDVFKVAIGITGRGKVLVKAQSGV